MSSLVTFRCDNLYVDFLESLIEPINNSFSFGSVILLS